MRILIVGGGIGGLAAACALQQAGDEVAVFERAQAFTEVGAGLTLWPNALNALRRIGLGDRVLAAGGRMRLAQIRTWRGKVLSSSSLDSLEARFDAPAICIHRAELLSLLAGSLGQEALHLGVACIGVTQDPNGMRLTLADGHQESGDVLIGADGLRSTVRERLWGESSPQYAGYLAWRGVEAFESESLPVGYTCETWGCGQRFGLVPLGQGRVYWFATRNASADPSRPPRLKAEILAQFGAWHAPIREVIEATDEAAILQNGIYDREPMAVWGKGRVTLLGDAAHPMTPNLGQGACQAIEDAVVLARCLNEKGDAVSALRYYEALRQKRTARITQLSRRLGAMAQRSHPVACLLRNALMQIMPASLMEKQMESLLAFEA